MPFTCKGLCDIQIVLYKKLSFQKIGTEVYLCKICDKCVEIKDIIKNSLFKIKNRCICCNAKFRVKSRSKRKLCRCGCGEIINRVDNLGREKTYIKGHNWRLKKCPKRRCVICDTSDTQKSKCRGMIFPSWHKFHMNFLCHNCYNKKLYYFKKLKNLFKELNYSVIWRIIH